MKFADSSLNFPDLPPFPQDVPTAPLLRLSLQKLIDHDREELDRLWDASRNLGFFYLDLRDAVGEIDVNIQDLQSTMAHTNGSVDKAQYTNGAGADKAHMVSIRGNDFLSDAYDLFDVSDEFFGLPESEKVKYDAQIHRSFFGYKGYGSSMTDKFGTKDRSEFYNMSKDDMLSLSKPVPAPPMLNQHRPLLKSYMETSHAIIILLLERLETLLQLPASALTSRHAMYNASGDQARFVQSPPQPKSDRQVALAAHADFGSVTLLFNRLGGLQILPPSTDGMPEDQKVNEWIWVQPLRGHCIVNLGDAMVKFTRGLLRSNVHRVVNPPGEEQGKLTRTSLVYFSRPSDEVLLKPLDESDMIKARTIEGEVDDEPITSKKWVLRRAAGMLKKKEVWN